MIRKYFPRIMIWLFAVMYLLAACQASPMGQSAKNAHTAQNAGYYASIDCGR